MDDYRKELANKVYKNELKVLDLDDTFEFSCNTCGECCRNRNDILLNPFDIYRVSKHLNLTPYDFINKYCDVYLGDDSKLPIVSLKFKKIEDVGKTYTSCPFLRHRDGLVVCSIHDAKPIVCAAYPLGRIINYNSVTNTSNVMYFNQNVKCGGKDKKYTIREWFSSYGLDDSVEASKVFTTFLYSIYNIIDLKKLNENKKISISLKETYYNMLINLMYYQIDISKNIIDVLTKNIEVIYDKTYEFVTLLYIQKIDIRGSTYKFSEEYANTKLKKINNNTTK